jgi:hypothetical protein
MDYDPMERVLRAVTNGLAEPVTTAASAPPDPIGDLRAMQRRLDELRRTVICEPGREADVQAVVDALALPGLIEVIASDACPEGKILVLDRGALEAAQRELAEQLAGDLRHRGWPTPVDWFDPRTYCTPPPSSLRSLIAITGY